MAELTFATVTILKEVYLLSRFVARTAKSAAHSNTEREALQKELEYEHLYIRSFGLLFFQREGILVPNQDLNQEWLEKITWILDGLRLAESDYAKLAAERDTGYRRLSPYLNEPKESDDFNLLEFSDFDRSAREISNGETKNEVQLRVEPTSSRDVSGTQKKRLLPSLDWRWALSEKKQLQYILASSRTWTGKLKELVQLTMAVNQHNQMSAIFDLQMLARNENATFLGLSGHARVRQNIDSAPVEMDDLAITNAVLELPNQRTTLTLATLRSASSRTNVLVELKPLPDMVSGEDERNIIHLAQLLALSTGTDLSTIPLKGVIHLPNENAYAFVFDSPKETTDAPPVTLFDLIRRPHSMTPRLSLRNRFWVAQSIAKSLTALHADRWVHKSFRSRSIVFFYDRDGIMKQNPYLVNFEYSRSTNSATSWTYDDDVEKNLYRHPLRQRPPQKSFDQIHDLYALGIVLLEIGLWRTISSVKEQAQGVIEAGTDLDPETLAEYYLNTARRDLPHSMGEVYADAVATCLKGDFGVAVTDASFPLVVYDRVVQNLDLKRMLDS